MGRTITAVVAGYLTMFVLVFVSFSAAYLLLGPDGSFLPGTYDVTTTWIIVSLPLSLIAAVIGGLVCALVAPTPAAPRVLAALVLVLGIAMAVPVLTGGSTAPNIRASDVGNLEAMMQGRQPVWVALLSPLIGAVGALLGARLQRRGSTGARP
jgi:hypothetical protein